MAGSTIFLDLSLRQWLERLADGSPAPGGGSAAAVAGAMASSLVGMVARLSSESWTEAGGAVAQADALTARLAELAQADSDVYSASLKTLAVAGEIPAKRRDAELGDALARAAEAPLAIARTACDVALLAAEVAERAELRFQPDAEAAIALASAAAQSAARLVEVNLSATADDARVLEARAAAETAARAMRRSFPPA